MSYFVSLPFFPSSLFYPFLILLEKQTLFANQTSDPGLAFGRKTNNIRLEFISYILSTELKLVSAKEGLQCLREGQLLYSLGRKSSRSIEQVTEVANEQMALKPQSKTLIYPRYILNVIV